MAFVFDVPEAEAAGLPEGLRFFPACAAPVTVPRGAAGRHPDHLGSVNLVTDASGWVVESTTLGGEARDYALNTRT